MASLLQQQKGTCLQLFAESQSTEKNRMLSKIDATKVTSTEKAACLRYGFQMFYSWFFLWLSLGLRWVLWWQRFLSYCNDTLLLKLGVSKFIYKTLYLAKICYIDQKWQLRHFIMVRKIQFHINAVLNMNNAENILMVSHKH